MNCRTSSSSSPRNLAARVPQHINLVYWGFWWRVPKEIIAYWGVLLDTLFSQNDEPTRDRISTRAANFINSSLKHRKLMFWHRNWSLSMMRSDLSTSFCEWVYTESLSPRIHEMECTKKTINFRNLSLIIFYGRWSKYRAFQLHGMVIFLSCN